MTRPTARGAIAFADIVGFTEYTHTVGDAAAVDLLDAFETIVRATLPHDGRLVKTLGDGVLTFVPDAAEALYAALDQQRQFTLVGDAQRPLWVRIGVHYGEPIVRGDDLIGHDVNLAARVADQALPGEVVATDTCVRAALGGGLDGAGPLDVREIGPVFVKGVGAPVRLMRVGAGTVPRSATGGDHGHL